MITMTLFTTVMLETIAIKRRLYIRISMGSLAIVNKCQVVENTLDDI